jgi:hypothetical protein
MVIKPTAISEPIPLIAQVIGFCMSEPPSQAWYEPATTVTMASAWATRQVVLLIRLRSNDVSSTARSDQRAMTPIDAAVVSQVDSPGIRRALHEKSSVLYMYRVPR